MEGNHRGVHVVKRTLRDGTVKLYYYDRRTRKPLDPETLEPKAGAAKSGKWPPGSLGDVLAQYRVSTRYQNLKPNSKRIYDRAMANLEDAPVVDGVSTFALPFAGMRRRHVYIIRDWLAETPAIANQLVDFVSALFDWAIDREIVEVHIARKIERFPGGAWMAWEPWEVEHALATFREPLRRAVVLGLHTGQREGDLCSLRWPQWDGAGISMTQQKTGTELWVPCSRALAAELREWKRGTNSVYILSREDGTPFSPANFSTAFWRERMKHGVDKVFHGLRKTAVDTLIEAGCSPHEAMALTGHKSIKMLQEYAAKVNQRKLASAAVLRLENAGVKRLENE